MKKYIKHYLPHFICWNTLIYLLISFAVWNINPSQWSDPIRIGFCVLGPALWFLLLFSIYLSKAIYKIQNEEE